MGMKIAIIGAPERAVAWENHLSPHRRVEEVIISADIDAIYDVDACIIINPLKNDLNQTIKAVRMGWHIFLIAPLPTQTDLIRKLTRNAEESGSIVQLTHWPTLSQAGHWMMSQMPSPVLLDITYHLTPFEFNRQDKSLRDLWIDELAYCLRWVDSGIRHLDANLVTANKNDQNSAHFVLFIRFNNGTTASLQITNTALKNVHLRSASDRKMTLTCDVQEQNIRYGKPSNADGTMIYENKQFNPARSAEVAVTHFLKAVQMQKDALYNSHHAYHLSTVLDSMEKQLRKIS